MKRFVAGLAALMLAACGGPSLNESLEPYMGLKAPYIFGKLGRPDREGEIAGEKFYVWSWRHSGSMPIHKEESWEIDDDSEYCELRLFVTSEDNITDYDWKGNMDGCEKMAKILFDQ